MPWLLCQLSEATADLAEEHETATHATEMLDAESAERMRLEKELKDIQVSLSGHYSDGKVCTGHRDAGRRVRRENEAGEGAQRHTGEPIRLL